MQVSSTPSRQQVRSEASYRALVESALRLFHERGYAATTVSDIVAPTSYSPGAFYYHFANKAECFWHVAEYREELRGDWYSVPEGIDASNTTLAEVIGQALAQMSEALHGFTAWTLVTVDFYQQHRDDPEARERLAVLHESWRRQVGAFMENLQAGGWVDPNRDPAVLATQVVAFQEGLTTHANVFSLDQGLLQAASMDGLVRLLGPTP
jgi:AcrR family transcriptional regulator